MDPATLARMLRTRLVASPRPGAWLALVVRAWDADERGPAHWLVAAWAPGPTGLIPRLPEFAAIASPDRDRALAELFAHLPDGVVAHPVSTPHVDAALVAEIVLAVDRHLAPAQRDALAGFVAACRDADLAAIRARYTDREPGFERLVRGVLDGDADAR
ncbi:MAG TPA: hypothetical protein VEA81_18795 [Burkholderiaceae bacterium]|nr:hypothetical protein [Burkholderiaceae bacterium]